jgi:uncharacterized protein (TIGR02145 family)
MKRITIFFAAIILGLATMAQIHASPKGEPQGINYQTVIRDGEGNILPGTEISLQMTIRTGVPDGAVEYAETHDAVPNAFGLVNLVIGYGVPQSNAFADINWGDGDKYLETAIDLTGNGSYTILGVTQFLSVPYAFYSQTTEFYNETDPEFNAWDKSTGITITENQITDLQDYLTEEVDGDVSNELQTLSQSGNTVTLSRGGGSFMTGVKSYTQAQIDAMSPYNGLVVFNTSTNCINYYNLNNWFEACGICTPQPTQAMAGNDTILIGDEFSVNLNANTPAVGEGLWTVLIGEGGVFDDATNPFTIFTGQADTDYTLQWAISTVCDTSYDEVNVSFCIWVCGLPFADERDGQSYETVLIGDQCWMAENLNIGTMVNGSSNQTDNEDIEKYCYNNSDANCDTYGGLYQWDEMMQYVTTEGAQGICMDGWHLPTDAEWCVLEQEVDPTITCSITGWRGVDGGGKLKETGTTHWNSPNTGATNSSGFTALPGGYRGTDGSLSMQGYGGYWWASSQNDASVAWSRYLYYGDAQVYRYDLNKPHGFAVRCLQD